MSIKKRLEELRAELRAENISYGELLELQSLAKHIEAGDVELLESAGVPEFPEEKMMTVKELIKKLETFNDQDQIVVGVHLDGEFQDCAELSIEEVKGVELIDGNVVSEIRLNINI
jgi:uncharacterized pyridoxal phosphate-containing UPF0001 family protein